MDEDRRTKMARNYKLTGGKARGRGNGRLKEDFEAGKGKDKSVPDA